MNTLQYKEYIANIAYDPDIDSFMGRVINARDVITFYGKSTEDLHREFEISVDDYLAYCREEGLEPGKPYSGQFRLRLPPLKTKALTGFIVKTLADHVDGVSA